MKKIILGLAGMCILMFACNVTNRSWQTPSPQSVIASETIPTTEASTLESAAPLSPLETATPSPTSAPAETLTASPTATAEWVFQGPDAVVVPILLYHQVAPPKDNSRYYVSPEVFEEQMQLLHNWGYQTITLEMLEKAINDGAELPSRPMLITFDDGNINNYTTAFPIMQKYGFTGVMYIVGSYLGAELFMDAGQIQEMVAAGWEVGSHSMRHRDLTTLDESEMKFEIIQSRKVLERELGVPVRSFAYPFGLFNSDAVNLTNAAGYTTAMSLGSSSDQGTWNVFALQRRDVSGRYDLKKFAFFLPWQGDVSFLPTDTPTPSPTPSRTPRVSPTP